jgi:pimeloyl-ACP methyl ester carboxylesterase
LLIAGSDDMAAPVSEFALMQSSIQNNEYLLLKAAHISNIECAAEFTAAAAQFLKNKSIFKG